MPNLFPGAEWRPMPGQEKRPKRRKGRGVGFHVAVYGGPSIYDINLRTGNDAHLYVRYDGSVEQNVDLDLQAWAGAAGNGSMIWVETAGATKPATVNTEPWTPQQAATLARIARWAHDTEGVPLQLMPDSRPTSRGIGSHRLGIQHSRGVGAVPGWLVAGGEKWSSVLGKECPGNAKLVQIPSIIADAANGNLNPEDDMPLNADDARTVEIRAYTAARNLFLDMESGANTDARRSFIGMVTAAVAPLQGEVAALKKASQGAASVQPGAAVQVSAAEVAQALAANTQFVAAIGEAAAVAMDRRSRDGDPATGPVS